MARKYSKISIGSITFRSIENTFSVSLDLFREVDTLTKPFQLKTCPVKLQAVTRPQNVPGWQSVLLVCRQGWLEGLLLAYLQRIGMTAAKSEPCDVVVQVSRKFGIKSLNQGTTSVSIRVARGQHYYKSELL